MKRYTLSRMAAADLREIYGYVARQNPDAARKLKAAFIEKFQFLSAQRNTGESRPDLGPDLRIFSLGNYAILFRETSRGIQIVRVLHAARDLRAILGNN